MPLNKINVPLPVCLYRHLNDIAVCLIKILKPKTNSFIKKKKMRENWQPKRNFYTPINVKKVKKIFKNF